MKGEETEVSEGLVRKIKETSKETGDCGRSCKDDNKNRSEINQNTNDLLYFVHTELVIKILFFLFGSFSPL